MLSQATGCHYSLVSGRGVLSCTGGIDSGDGTYQGGIITSETTTNGGTYELGIFGPANQNADRCIVLPDQQPQAGQVLKATSAVVDVLALDKTWSGCQVMTWEAESGGAGGSATGAYYAPFGVDAGTYQTLGAANRVELGGVVLPYNINLTRAVVGVDSTTSGGLIAGIYDAACNLLADSTAVTVTGSGKYTLSFSPALPLTAGTLYYFAWSSDNASMKLETADDQYDPASFLSAAGFGLSTGNPSTGSGASLSLPSACGSQQAGGTAPTLILSGQ